MAKVYGGDPVRTQDEITDAGRTVDAGRKGGAVSAAPYREEGPRAGRGFDATAAASEQSRLRAFWPLIVAALAVGLLIFGALNFRPRTSPASEGQTVSGVSRPAGDVGLGRSNQSTQGVNSGQ